ncbi:MAG TPA: hypothetical protein VGC54_02940, partial [Planctomycetota bacterium]
MYLGRTPVRLAALLDAVLDRAAVDALARNAGRKRAGMVDAGAALLDALGRSPKVVRATAIQLAERLPAEPLAPQEWRLPEAGPLLRRQAKLATLRHLLCSEEEARWEAAR